MGEVHMYICMGLCLKVKEKEKVKGRVNVRRSAGRRGRRCGGKFSQRCVCVKKTYSQPPVLPCSIGASLAHGRGREKSTWQRIAVEAKAGRGVEKGAMKEGPRARSGEAGEKEWRDEGPRESNTSLLATNLS